MNRFLHGVPIHSQLVGFDTVIVVFVVRYVRRVLSPLLSLVCYFLDSPYVGSRIV